MHVSREAYHAFSAPLEGRVPTMYADCLGLITTGVGNLINTQAAALALPWRLADGLKASQAAVLADWNKLHADPAYYAARKWTVYSKTMLCHLDDDAIDALVSRQLDLNEAIIRKRFPAWDSFPADAQLAIMSVAWAVGAGFFLPKPQGPGFINLAKCIDAQDWEGCVAACPIREKGNPGVVPRNAKNRFCFHNAALVKAAGLLPDGLWWPNVVVDEHGRAPAAATTAQAEAVAAVTTWQADPISRFVDAEYERLRETSGARAAIDFERDTDPSELAPDSDGGRS